MNKCKFCGEEGSLTEYVVCTLSQLEEGGIPEEVHGLLCEKCVDSIKGEE